MNQKSKVLTVWITKYALTKGVFSTEVYLDADEHSSRRRVSEKEKQEFAVWPASYYEPDWHETKEAALARANEMRVKKIASLKKQVKALEAMKFD